MYHAIVANCLLIECAIILICFMMLSEFHICTTGKIRKTLLIMKRSEEILTQEQQPAYVKFGFFRIAIL